MAGLTHRPDNFRVSEQFFWDLLLRKVGKETYDQLDAGHLYLLVKEMSPVQIEQALDEALAHARDVGQTVTDGDIETSTKSIQDPGWKPRPEPKAARKPRTRAAEVVTFKTVPLARDIFRVTDSYQLTLAKQGAEEASWEQVAVCIQALVEAAESSTDKEQSLVRLPSDLTMETARRLLLMAEGLEESGWHPSSVALSWLAHKIERLLI